MIPSEIKTVLLAGGSGLIGTRLREHLESKNYKVINLTRKAGEPDKGYFHWDPEKKVVDQEAIKQADILINLAGTSIADSRWTARQKRKIINSRIFATDLLTQTLLTTPNKITSVINASAIGIYGHTDNRIIREENFLATDFLGLTCKRWEDAAANFKKSGKRLVIFRIGLVLSEDGGFLKPLLKALNFGIAPVFGSGEQYQSWIHIDDLCKMINKAIINEKIEGVYNAVGPCPLSNYNFMKLLAQLKEGNQLIIKIPAFIMKLILGEMSALVLEGTRASSKKIEETGFTFTYPQASYALRNILHKH